MVDFYGKEEHIVRFLNHPFQNVCTDGLLGGKPHPRAYGSFPRVISKYVREEKELSLENAINKMTYKPAKVFGFLDRGYLKEGNFADIVIFDLEKIRDKGTYEDPIQYPEGINTVIINGKIVFENGVYNKILVGKVISSYWKNN